MNNTCPACKSTNTQDASIRENNGIYGPGAASWVVEEKSLCNDCGVYFKPMAQSNEPTISEMNEAIALFDGWKLIKGDPTHKCNFCFAGDEPCAPAMDRFLKDSDMRFRFHLQYHSSWNRLKPVIDEIFKYALAYPDQVKPIIAMSVVVDIKAAHERVYKFCKWYNQQKKKDDKETKTGDC